MKLKHVVMDLFTASASRHELEILRAALADYSDISSDAIETTGGNVRLALQNNLEIAQAMQLQIEDLLNDTERL